MPSPAAQVEQNEASEECFIAAIASGGVVLMEWFWVVAAVLCRRMHWITESSTRGGSALTPSPCGTDAIHAKGSQHV
jgi:hypothetical protein